MRGGQHTGGVARGVGQDGLARERPRAGEAGVGEGDDSGGVVGVGVVLLVVDPEEGRVDRQSADAHGPVVPDEDTLGDEREVVQPATAGRLEDDGDLAGDPPDLLGRQARTDELAQGAVVGPVSLGDPGVPAVCVDVEDPDEAGVADAAGAPGGVKGGLCVLVVGGEDVQHDVTREVCVAGQPALARGSCLDPSREGVPPERGSRVHSVHVGPLPS